MATKSVKKRLQRAAADFKRKYCVRTYHEYDRKTGLLVSSRSFIEKK